MTLVDEDPDSFGNERIFDVFVALSDKVFFTEFCLAVSTRVTFRTVTSLFEIDRRDELKKLVTILTSQLSLYCYLGISERGQSGRFFQFDTVNTFKELMKKDK